MFPWLVIYWCIYTTDVVIQAIRFNQKDPEWPDLHARLPWIGCLCASVPRLRSIIECLRRVQANISNLFITPRTHRPCILVIAVRGRRTQALARRLPLANHMIISQQTQEGAYLYAFGRSSAWYDLAVAYYTICALHHASALTGGKRFESRAKRVNQMDGP